MPRIPDVLLGSVIYLYQSTDRAPKGGSGFITSVEEGGYTHISVYLRIAFLKPTRYAVGI
jgi:hypothetical protein